MATPNKPSNNDSEESVDIKFDTLKEFSKWDPFQSADWDLEKPASESLVRMKRLTPMS